MLKEVRPATIQDFDFIYDSLREDLEEQGVLHRFNYSKEAFKEVIFGKKPLGTFLILLICSSSMSSLIIIQEILKINLSNYY